MNIKRYATTIALLVLSSTYVSYSAQCPASIPQGSSESCNPVVKDSIAWTFDGDHIVGQFVNGDYWAVVDNDNDVDLITITPAAYNNGGEDWNGSMVNPIPGYNQGYTAATDYYEETENAAKDLPLALVAGDSIVSTVTTDSGYQTVVESASVLTIVASAPASGSFRPGYCDTDNTLWNTSDLDYTKLATLALVTNSPATPSAIEDDYARVWVDHLTGASGNWIHPEDNMPAYGNNMALAVGRVACALHLNYTNEQKENLLIYFAQIGIDLYSIYNTGIANSTYNMWHNDGGVALGRKTPILFAGIVLNDAGMKAIGDKSGDYILEGTRNNPPSDYFHFGEDDQTFYVTSDTVTYGSSYTSSHIDMPEWGIRAASNDSLNNASWTTDYRYPINGASYFGLILPMHIMDAKSLWNHDVLFDYTDRSWAIGHEGESDPFGYTVPDEVGAGAESPIRFVSAMWDAYRDDYPSGNTGSMQSGTGAIQAGTGSFQ